MLIKNQTRYKLGEYQVYNKVNLEKFQVLTSFKPRLHHLD